MEQIGKLAGFRMLVVEDEALIAMLVEDFLTDLGVVIVETTATVARAMAIVTDVGVAIDGAILDVSLAGEPVFPVADALLARGIPFVFASGYGAQGLAPRYAKYPVIMKPFRLEPFKMVLLSAFT